MCQLDLVELYFTELSSMYVSQFVGLKKNFCVRFWGMKGSSSHSVAHNLLLMCWVTLFWCFFDSSTQCVCCPPMKGASLFAFWFFDFVFFYKHTSVKVRDS